MPSFRNLTGKKFGRLTAIRLKRRDNLHKAMWEFKCECGKTKVLRGDEVSGGYVVSCGCAYIKHGHFVGDVPTREYRSWDHMRQRCLNPKNHAFKDYGGRGIRICKRWLKSFTSFIEDMGPRPPNTSLDRINNNAGYKPSNCRWATCKVQNNNTRRTCGAS